PACAPSTATARSAIAPPSLHDALPIFALIGLIAGFANAGTSGIVYAFADLFAIARQAAVLVFAGIFLLRVLNDPNLVPRAQQGYAPQTGAQQPYPAADPSQTYGGQQAFDQAYADPAQQAYADPAQQGYADSAQQGYAATGGQQAYDPAQYGDAYQQQAYGDAYQQQDAQQTDSDPAQAYGTGGQQAYDPAQYGQQAGDAYQQQAYADPAQQGYAATGGQQAYDPAQYGQQAGDAYQQQGYADPAQQGYGTGGQQAYDPYA